MSRRVLFITTFCALMVGCALLAPAQAIEKAADAKSKSDHKTKVDVHYDKKKNATTVGLAPLTVWSATGEGRSLNSIELSAAFTYPGHNIAVPKTVDIVISASSTSGRQFTYEHNLVVTADDVRLNFGEMKVFGSRTNSPIPQIGGSVLAFEMLALSIPYEDWLKIATAKKVKMQVGSRQVELSNKHLQALGDLAELMQQEGQEFK